MVSYLHEILVKLPTVHSLCIMSVITQFHASPVLSIHPSDDEHQEILDELPGTNYGEENPSKITVKFPYDVTLTLHQAKFLKKTPGNSNRGNFTVELLSGQKWVRFMELNLQNHVLGVFEVVPCTMSCSHGSNNKTQTKWDPGPTYVVQRLWDPVDQATLTSRSSIPINLEKLGHPKSYLDLIHLLPSSSQPLHS